MPADLLPLPGGIQAVTFDVGGTLLQPWPSVGHVYRAVAGELGWPGLDAHELNRRFRHAWKQKQDFDHSRAAWRGLVEATFAGLGPATIEGPFFERLYHRFGEADVWRVFPDVRPCLERLGELGMKLGAVSNWDERLRPLLSDLDLARYFDVMVISHEIGAAKPAPEIFEQAVRLLGVPAGAVVHVGDSEAEDVAGASAAGLTGVLLDRDGGGGAERRAAVVRDLRELADWLAGRR